MHIVYKKGRKKSVRVEKMTNAENEKKNRICMHDIKKSLVCNERSFLLQREERERGKNDHTQRDFFLLKYMCAQFPLIF